MNDARERCVNCRSFKPKDSRRIHGVCLKWIAVPDRPGDPVEYQEADVWEWCHKYERGLTGPGRPGDPE